MEIPARAHGNRDAPYGCDAAGGSFGVTSAAGPDPDLRPAWRRPIALPRLPASADLRALAGLAAIVAALCWPVVAHGQIYWERDLHLYLYPHAEAFVRVLAQGSLPLWNPYVAFGEPLLANPYMQVYYPATWLHLLVEPWWWWAGMVVAHLLLTGAGAYRLARRLGMSPMGAFVAGATWLGSGPLLSLVTLGHHLIGAAWIPWVLATSDAAAVSRRARDAMIAGVVLAIQILAGSPDMSTLAVVLAMANVLRHVDWRAWAGRDNRRLVLAVLIMLALGLGLSAAQWIPTLDLAARASRFDQPQRVRTYWSTHPANLGQVLLPVTLHTLPLSSRARAALFESREPFLTSLYLGLAAAVLVLAASVERRAARPIAFLLAILVLAALGRHTPVFEVVTTLVPPLRVLRYPVKAMVAAALLWSLLAGMGIDALREPGPRRWRFTFLALAIGLLAVAGAAGLAIALQPEAWGAMFLERTALDPPFAAVLRPTAARVLWATGLGAAIWGAAVAARVQPRAWAAGIAGVAVVADLLVAHCSLNLTCAPELMAWRPGAVDLVRAGEGRRTYSYDYYAATRGRASLSHPPYALAAPPSDPVVGAVALRGALFPLVLSEWGVESSYDLDQQGLFPKGVATLSRLLRLTEGTPTHLRLLRMGAVARVAALHTVGFEDLSPVATLPTLFQEPLRVYAVPDPVARASVVGGVVVADGDDALAALQDRNFDPARTIILPAGIPMAAPPVAPGRCRVVRWKPDRITLEAEMDGPGYVVFVDTYDPGWRAHVDGRPATLLRANVAFRAVAVPAGRHHIESVYRPPAVGLGLALSAASAAVALAAAWSRRGI
jgi:hypothetical protein